nr:uncharacterized protein LOC128684693 [Cherax quadricarinatus]
MPWPFCSLCGLLRVFVAAVIFSSVEGNLTYLSFHDNDIPSGTTTWAHWGELHNDSFLYTLANKRATRGNAGNTTKVSSPTLPLKTLPELTSFTLCYFIMFTGNTTNNIPFCYYHPQYTVFTSKLQLNLFHSSPMVK